MWECFMGLNSDLQVIIGVVSFALLLAGFVAYRERSYEHKERQKSGSGSV